MFGVTLVILAHQISSVLAPAPVLLLLKITGLLVPLCSKYTPLLPVISLLPFVQ
ncbi:hypothetical protein [Intestinibacter sp.]|uniref:hypothetical protein n=1 Tax=Intestinibacter sp. TaxID=1965304 RepID=UPI002A74A318|nr:hypothetical protein [Intestinibacter sp.]MDY2736135.1 hypothetical protein [Intestinibacter sp.]